MRSLSPAGMLGRYSLNELAPNEPFAEHYAAARRWLACAREARRWALEASSRTESYFWAQACDALLRADSHRALARRWRPPPSTAPPLDGTLRGQARTAERLRRTLTIDACYAAARKAVHLARAYRCEPDSTGRRERECLEQVARWRAAIRELRTVEGVALDGPGVRKAALAVRAHDRAATSRGRAS